VFAQLDPPGTGKELAGAETERRGNDRKAHRKPLPVDFHSWFSLRLLEQLARGASSHIILTECSPDLDELWLRDECGRLHVAEFLIELYNKNRGHCG
jgi:hypothetical protein